VPNDIDATVIERVFLDWRVERIAAQRIASATRRMPALVVRLSGPA